MCKIYVLCISNWLRSVIWTDEKWPHMSICQPPYCNDTCANILFVSGHKREARCIINCAAPIGDPLRESINFEPIFSSHSLNPPPLPPPPPFRSPDEGNLSFDTYKWIRMDETVKRRPLLIEKRAWAWTKLTIAVLYLLSTQSRTSHWI